MLLASPANVKQFFRNLPIRNAARGSDSVRAKANRVQIPTTAGVPLARAGLPASAVNIA